MTEPPRQIFDVRRLDGAEGDAPASTQAFVLTMSLRTRDDLARALHALSLGRRTLQKGDSRNATIDPYDRGLLKSWEARLTPPPGRPA